jgi:hypothetical protein
MIMSNTKKVDGVLKRLTAIRNNMANLDVKDPKFTEKYLEQGNKLRTILKELNKF